MILVIICIAFIKMKQNKPVVGINADAHIFLNTKSNREQKYHKQ